MKKFSRRLLCLAATLVLTLSLPVPMACAAEQASYYFASTSAVAYAEDNGKIYIEADALATDIMDVIGVESITIYEKQSDGYYDDVYVYTRYNTAGMTRANNVEHFKSVTYQGTVGKKYYATVAFYAENDEGSETLYHDTYVVTAVSVAP